MYLDIFNVATTQKGLAYVKRNNPIKINLYVSNRENQLDIQRMSNMMNTSKVFVKQIESGTSSTQRIGIGYMRDTYSPMVDTIP